MRSVEGHGNPLARQPLVQPNCQAVTGVSSTNFNRRNPRPSNRGSALKSMLQVSSTRAAAALVTAVRCRRQLSCPMHCHFLPVQPIDPFSDYCPALPPKSRPHLRSPHVSCVPAIPLTRPRSTASSAFTDSYRCDARARGSIRHARRSYSLPVPSCRGTSQSVYCRSPTFRHAGI